MYKNKEKATELCFEINQCADYLHSLFFVQGNCTETAKYHKLAHEVLGFYDFFTEGDFIKYTYIGYRTKGKDIKTAKADLKNKIAELREITKIPFIGLED